MTVVDTLIPHLCPLWFWMFGFTQVLHQFFNANKRRAKVVFDDFDIDGGGSLDIQSEMVFFLKRLMPSVSKEQLRYFGQMIDIDGDGAVDFDELLAAVKEMHDLGASLKESIGMQVGATLRSHI